MSDNIGNSLIHRLQAYISYTGLTNSQFADRAGISRPSLSQFLHGRNKSVNDTLLRKLDENFPQLNLTWLLFGRGDMLTNVNFETSEPQNKIHTTGSDAQLADNKQIAGSTNTNIRHFEDLRNSELGNLFSRDDAADRYSGASNTTADENPELPLANETTESPKQIKSIIVFYSDNSFETFYPG